MLVEVLYSLVYMQQVSEKHFMNYLEYLSLYIPAPVQGDYSVGLLVVPVPLPVARHAIPFLCTISNENVTFLFQ